MSTPTTSSGAARNAYLDTLRGWSIAGVVCVHFAGSFVTTDAHAWSPSFFLGLTLNQGFSFAVPLFVFLSGLLAGLSRSHVSLGDYYRSRLWRIGFPYLLASLASFVFLNHYATWQAIPGLGAKFTWLWQRLFFYGIEPTLYFIPLILQLYLLQPVLKRLPQWLHRALPALNPTRAALLLTGLLLGLHLTLGLLCDRGSLSYYTWARPNGLFWAFYFFAGLHFSVLAAALSRRAWVALGLVALLAAAGAMGWNALHLLDRQLMGAHFEFNRLDFAYARPEMLVYDLAMVTALATGVALGWTARAGLAAYLGRFTLEIYLWHILVLYFGVWRYADALESCRRQPELIVIICLGTAVLIAVATDLLQRLRTFAASHRLTFARTD